MPGPARQRVSSYDSTHSRFRRRDTTRTLAGAEREAIAAFGRPRTGASPLHARRLFPSRAVRSCYRSGGTSGNARRESATTRLSSRAPLRTPHGRCTCSRHRVADGSGGFEYTRDPHLGARAIHAGSGSSSSEAEVFAGRSWWHATHGLPSKSAVSANVQSSRKARPQGGAAAGIDLRIRAAVVLRLDRRFATVPGVTSAHRSTSRSKAISPAR